MGSVVTNTFPDFPEHWVPKGPAILNAFLCAYLTHKDGLRREISTLISSSALAMDHQCRLSKTAKAGDDEVAGQSLTIVGDLELVLFDEIVPTTGEEWNKIACEELEEQHTASNGKYLTHAMLIASAAMEN